MKHLITNIDTYIKDRELFVSIYIEAELYPVIETSYKSITRTVGQISIFELDILAGCYLEPSSFYNIGDKMSDGKVAKNDKEFPKTWKITHEETLDELREKSKISSMTFQSIYNIEISQKNNKVPYVKITTTDDKVYFTSLHSFKSLVGIGEDEFRLLTGAFLSPIMYKKGDTSVYNGRFNTITQENKIVATFNIRIEGTIDNNFNLYGDVRMKKEIKYSGNERYPGDDDNDGRYRSSYEKYNGYNGFDDDTIDNAFEGDPSATWNVD